jgi:hypothetical protein
MVTLIKATAGVTCRASSGNGHIHIKPIFQLLEISLNNRSAYRYFI